MDEIRVNNNWKSNIPTNENIYVAPIISENAFVPLELNVPIQPTTHPIPDKFKYIQVKEWLHEINDNDELTKKLDTAWTAEEIESIALRIITEQKRVGVDKLVELMYKWFRF